MGACYSCVVAPTVSTKALVELESSLSIGDVVLLQDLRAANPNYISKGASWTTFTHVGFLVRDGLGASGLALCHADYRTSHGRQVVKVNLQDAIESGRYHMVLVRRLCKQLSSEQQDLVTEFVDLNLGKVSPLMTPHATILMAHSLTAGCERLHCSEFVATMLHLVGLVAPTPDNPHEFSATHPKGYILEPPLALQLPPPTPPPMRSASSGSLKQQAPSSRTTSPASSAASLPRLKPCGSQLDLQQHRHAPQQAVAAHGY